MDLIIIIQAVFVVLQVILFFKIWGMANDVKKLTKGVLPLSRDWAFKAEILKGNRENAKKILLDNLIFDMGKFYSGTFGYYDSLEEIKAAYRPKFEKLNCQIPEEIEKLERISDIEKLL